MNLGESDNESLHFRGIFWRDVHSTHADEFQWIFFWGFFHFDPKKTEIFVDSFFDELCWGIPIFYEVFGICSFFIISWVNRDFPDFWEDFFWEPSEVSGVRHHSMTHCDCENWSRWSPFFWVTKKS